MGGAELVKRTLEAFNRRDVERMLALQHPEAEIVPITAAMEGRVLRSADEVREFVRSIDLDWEVFQARPEEYYETDERGLAVGSWDARGRASGVELGAHRGAWLAVVREGLVYRWRTYTNRAEALEAFGVGEGQLADHRVDLD